MGKSFPATELAHCSCCRRECLVVYHIALDAFFCSPTCHESYATIHANGFKSGQYAAREEVKHASTK